MSQNLFHGFLEINPMISFGVMLLIGLLGGQIAHNTRYFPRIMGYIIFGFILGPHVTAILSNKLILFSVIFKEIAIGLILFELGVQINLKFLIENSTIIWTVFLQGILVFVLIFLGLHVFHVSWAVSALCGAIGISISPAITLLIANEYNAKGRVISFSLILTALNNIVSFLAYALVVTVVQHSHNKHGNLHEMLLEWLYPIYRMLGSVILACLSSVLIIGIGRYVGKKENMQFILLIGMLTLLLGLSKMLLVSPYLTMLIFGISTFNLDRKESLMEVELGFLGEIFVVILFVMVGASLHVDYFLKSGWIVLFFIVLRSIGNILPVFFFHKRQSFNMRQCFSMGITFLPMAGIALALLDTTRFLDHQHFDLLSFIVLPAVALLEIIGPITTIFGLRYSGELDGRYKIEH